MIQNWVSHFTQTIHRKKNLTVFIVPSHDLKLFLISPKTFHSRCKGHNYSHWRNEETMLKEIKQYTVINRNPKAQTLQAWCPVLFYWKMLPFTFSLAWAMPGNLEYRWAGSGILQVNLTNRLKVQMDLDQVKSGLPPNSSNYMKIP